MAVKVTLAKYAVWNAFRTQPAMQAEIKRRLDRIANACGSDYEADMSETSTKRARGVVYPSTPAAERDNARNLTVLRNLDAGRG